MKNYDQKIEGTHLFFFSGQLHLETRTTRTIIGAIVHIIIVTVPVVSLLDCSVHFLRLAVDEVFDIVHRRTLPSH